jgi:hypothetical protein
MIKEIQVPKNDGSTETYILIDHGNGEFTSMTKAHYEQQLAQATENFPN